ncbi:MAG: hypothetical protein E4H10_09210 [Bacteroidia bacterium]|nr:MAG: hypothetical protein E4H10_09210 [Bacteroidia bacterium]
MKSVIFTRTILLTPALFFSIVTCYGQDDPSDQLVGKWTKALNERSITFTFSSDNKYQVEFAGDAEIDVYGSYMITGTQITFNDEGGEYSSDEPGAYEFKVSDTSLTFTQVDDTVYGRSMLVVGTWSRASPE